jgi:hypothetical protein
MLKQTLRILLLPAICVLWLFGWICYNVGTKQDKAKHDTDYLSLTRLTTLRLTAQEKTPTYNSMEHSTIKKRILA